MARTDQPHKLTLETWIERCTDFSDPRNEKHRDLNYTRPETKSAWNGSKSKVPIWCNIHQEFFTQLPANHMSLGQGCPKCGKRVYKEKRRKKDPVAHFRRTHGDMYDYSRVEYVNSHTPVEIVCPAHGPFFQKPLNHQNGEGCPQCWETRRKAFGRARNDDFRALFPERAARIHGGAYSILRAPERAHDTVLLNCPKHGDFEQKAFSHLAGHGCPSCGRVTSHQQKEMAAFIESLGVEVEHENRTVLGGLHIDIWAPERNIGVEYHGSYWHKGDSGKRHREKWERAVSSGVRLIQIFDFEWLDRRKAVENRLRGLFGVCETMAARKCELREVSSLEAHRFFQAWHTQGAAAGKSVSYGLFHGELIACISFGKSRSGKAQWELLRYASKGRVQGGFSRLLSAFVNECKPESVASFCDLRWGDGKVYETNGFTLDHVSVPDYWYADERGNRISRYKARRKPEGLSEREWAKQNGWHKMLGVGHQLWLMSCTLPQKA